MNLDRNTLVQQAAATGFQAEALEKIQRLGEFLASAGRHPLLSHVLVLKGGTALNLFYGSPKRLSVDLDFNYIGNVEREAMLRERPEVERAIEIIADGLKYRVQRAADEHAGRKFYLRYKNVFGIDDRIEVDINYLFRIPLADAVSRTMWQPEESAGPEYKIVSTEELFTGKSLAMLDRVAPRDLYDVIHLPAIGPAVWSSDRFRKIFIATSGTLVRPLYEYTQSRLDRVDDRIINEQLLPMIKGGESVTAAILRQRAWEAVRPLLELNNEEKEYIERLHEGELRPDLLFPDDPNMIEKITLHPALRWKIQNVLEYRSS